VNTFEKYEWLSDYALAFGQVDGGTSKICWASDSGAGVNYCGCAQCEEARKLVPLYSLVLATNERLDHRTDELAQAITKLHLVEGWLEQALNGWAGSGKEFADEYGELAEIVGFEMTREIEVTITWSQAVTVKVPFGEEPSDGDFWAYGNRDVESNFVIEDAQAPEVEDVAFSRY
jgi:hypothetical protein